MRREAFENGEFYHVYNRGVDKRQITLDSFDSNRFLQGLKEFNTADAIGSLRDNACGMSSGNTMQSNSSPLVDIAAYCLNPNHFHLILRQLEPSGISIFLKAQCGGYSRYFNTKYHRTGSLFEGRFKVKWIQDDEELR